MPLPPPISLVAAAVVVLPAAAFLIFLTINQHRTGKSTKSGERRLPPGPRPWPVIGHLVNLALLLHFGEAGLNIGGEGSDAKKQRKPLPLHAALASLSRVYGPVMHLRLGCQHVVVVSSADAAREALRIHDRSLAGRAMPAAFREPKYSDHSMIWNGDDDQWRRLRGICRSDLLATSRLEAHAGARERKAWEMVRFLIDEAAAGREVRVANVAFRAVLDMFGWMVMSRDDMAGGFQEGARGVVDWDLKKDFAKGLQLGGVPNLEDLFPSVFGGWDLQRIRKQTAEIANRVYAWAEKMVNQRKEARKHQKMQPEEEGRTAYSGQDRIHNDDDFLDVLLRCGVDGLQLYALFEDLFTAAIDTTATCIEWTMAELVKNPHVMARLKDELSDAMDEPASSSRSDNQHTSQPQLMESQLLRLPYLQACVKESLRLHPPAPLLLPHRAKESCELAGYYVPEGSTVLVNAWAIGRASDRWGADALMFDPERFLGTDCQRDFRGLDFDFIPFGSGRRACPGMALANRFVQLLVASMVYYFDWDLPGGGGKEIDLSQLSMEEKQGIVLDRKEPLVLVPKLVWN